MPFKSLAQLRWAHTEAGTKALGGLAKLAEWDAATKGMKLPQYASKNTAQNKAIHAAIRARQGR